MHSGEEVPPAQAARLAGVHVKTIHQWRKEGRIEARWADDHWLIALPLPSAVLEQAARHPSHVHRARVTQNGAPAGDEMGRLRRENAQLRAHNDQLSRQLQRAHLERERLTRVLDRMTGGGDTRTGPTRSRGSSPEQPPVAPAPRARAVGE